MTLISPDVLTAARGLSAGGAGCVLGAGLLVWALGWRWHRFWVVFGVTLAAGVAGLSAGKAAGGQVLVVGVLLAVAAGVLALELAKILAFVTGGTAAWVATQTVFPQSQEVWAAFLVGGTVGVLLYRLWTMLVTSFVGCLMAAHAGLMLAADRSGGFDPAAWAGSHPAALNGAVAVLTVLGVLAQAWTSPRPKDGDHARKADPKPDRTHPGEPAGYGKAGFPPAG